MNKTIVVTLTILLLSGCTSHHETQQQINQQANKNAVNNALSGGPMTSSTKPITDFSLSGYGKPAGK